MNVNLPSMAELQEAGCVVSTAPSVRVPVTSANRALLRFLRTAEQAAWETASPDQAGHVLRSLSRTVRATRGRGAAATGV